MASPVDTSVKFFHSGQIGAPVLTGAAGSMIALLDACLVNGFGIKSVTSLVVSGGVATITVPGTHSSQVDTVVTVDGVTNLTTLNGEQKVTATGGSTISFATTAANGTATGTITVKQAPAGWAKPYTGTNLAVYRSNDVTSNRRYVRIADTTTNSSRVIVYEAMTAISTGTGLMPTAAQLSGGGYLPKLMTGYGLATTDAAGWAIFANGKRVLLFIRPLWALGYTAGSLFGFGDFPSLKSGDVYNTFLAASLDNISYGTSLGLLVQGDSFWVQRLHTAAAGAVVGGSWTPFAAGSNYAGAGPCGPFPSPVGGGLLLAEAMLNAGDIATYGFRGSLPGRWHTPQSIVDPLIAHGDIVPGVGAAAGRNLFALHVTNHPSNSGPNPGTFIDVTGPWG